MARELAEMHRNDAHLPLTSRHNVGLFMALRPWELEVFKPLRRGGD